MRYMPVFKLKRTSTDPSDAIIVTFAGRWLDAIHNHEIVSVFRKMGPTDFTPRVVYLYVAAPTSAIVARSRLRDYAHMAVSDALKVCKSGRLSEAELRDYAGSYKELIVMRLGDIEIAQHPISLKELADDFDYWPSSTFIPLSGTGVETLDRVGRFLPAKRKCVK